MKFMHVQLFLCGVNISNNEELIRPQMQIFKFEANVAVAPYLMGFICVSLPMCATGNTALFFFF